MCTRAMHSGGLCIHHQPIKAEKSDRCGRCGRVFGVEERVRVGLCNTCYNKPETVVTHKKAFAEKEAA
jgi:hypothetical protein